MQSAQTRRRLLATLSCTMAASAFGGARISAQDAPPETTTIRLAKIPGICVAPQYIAEELLRIEGFSEVRYVDVPLDQVHRAVGSDNIDLSIGFIAQYIIELDLATPIVLLSGVHVGCFELFGTKRVNAIRDLKGKTVSVPALGSAHHSFIASMAAYVGVDAKREINFVAHPLGESARLLAEEKVDALMGFPPVPQELRQKKIGHVVVSSGLDRPWSQYLCCIVAGNREFVRRHPVATKRAVRAIAKATDFCAAEPEQAARLVAAMGYQYDYALQTMKEIPYARWRDYDPDDAIRFYALRLREAGMIKASPASLIAQGTDWRIFNELKRQRIDFLLGKQPRRLAKRMGYEVDLAFRIDPHIGRHAGNETMVRRSQRRNADRLATFETFTDVRYMAAFDANADISRTSARARSPSADCQAN